MKVVINKYTALSDLELGVKITIDDIKKLHPNLANWQAQHVMARLAREHETGVFYGAAIEQIDKWAKEMYPEKARGSEKLTTSEQKET
tara:strand:+ start:1646 stop:1909 length:264 start_codon:yes stop_codon:yes gene_type:complete